MLPDRAFLLLLYDIRRLVIDGMTSYSATLENQREYRDFFHAMASFSKFRLMTTFINYENPELFGISSFMPDVPVSSIVDNMILLALVELGNTYVGRTLTNVLGVV